MGNSSSSSSSRISKKSESMEIRSNANRKASVAKNDFCKSKSMMDVSTKSSSRVSSLSTTSATPRQKSITSIKEKDNKSKNNKDSKYDISRQKSIKKEAPHPISQQSRDIISQCFENPHSEFANKVVQRIFEKRDDYQKFILNVGKDRSFLINTRLKILLEDIVGRIHDSEFIELVSRQYGEEHVELKQFGFKPDFWVAVADAMTLEGVILDMANHQPADTVSAWSSLVTMIFSSVRDGYYSELRRHRMSSRRTLKHQSTVDSKEEGEQPPPTERELSSRLSMSTIEDTTQPSSSRNSSGNYSKSARTMSCYSTDSSCSRRNGSETFSPSTMTRRPIFE